MSRIFLSANEHRLRAGWRILGQILLLTVLMILSELIVLPSVEKLSLPFDVITTVNQIIWLIIVTLSIFLARRYLDKRTFASLGLQWNQQTLPDLLFGFAIAGILMGFIYIVESAAGWLHFTGFVWQELPLGSIISQSLRDLIIFGITTSWYEELLDRGYRLHNLKDGLNLPWALFLSSAAFAARHLANPSASWISTLGIFLAGFFLAYGWIRTRQLWISLGLHAGWNFFEGVVFGFPVSGIHSFHLIKQTVSGPEWITGGDFGPEAGLILILAMLLGTILIYWWTQGKR